MRRQTEAAGYSWRKWGDPITYRRLPRWSFWAWSIALGAWSAISFVHPFGLVMVVVIAGGGATYLERWRKA